MWAIKLRSLFPDSLSLKYNIEKTKRLLYDYTFSQVADAFIQSDLQVKCKAKAG